MVKVDFQSQFYSLFGLDYELASKKLGKSPRQIRRYIETGRVCPTVKILVDIMYRGYLPNSNGWQDAFIDKDGVMHSPYGKVTSGDLTYVHNYKWAAHRATEQLKNARKRISELEQLSNSDEIQDALLDIVAKLARKTG
ncbi:helix-turn-helix domain-containing protein [Pseudoalteromonas piratica]|uniref:Uncharacterized protein n=1 Tax=Pseudoalteromonas piratica TaxID=1348114 RepID=A0A0A7EM95_9GAMM|nr:helix-turn-helix transcriptional regulator [Pseudoalteromonas piratica]AIY67082.1 hypothetical protein OM33_18585 [Pseudoalteromonas piratica]